MGFAGVMALTWGQLWLGQFSLEDASKAQAEHLRRERQKGGGGAPGKEKPGRVVGLAEGFAALGATAKTVPYPRNKRKKANDGTSSQRR